MHTPVLLKEAIDGMNIKKGDTLLDATFGGGGHTSEICKRFGLKGDVTILGIDADTTLLEHVGDMLKKCVLSLKAENFRNLDNVLEEEGIQEINSALFDLGVNTEHFESSGRGFSFLKDEPLLMTFNSKTEDILTARDIVNEWSEESIADILYGFADEQFSRAIAKGIIKSREEGIIETTSELVEIIENAVPENYKRRKIHPATKTFQALRMATNDELGALEEGLEKAFNALTKKGRLVVITFHSVEDRFVKRFFRSLEDEGSAKRITKKPIVPGEEELLNNPRSRTGKLRILEKK